MRPGFKLYVLVALDDAEPVDPMGIVVAAAALGAVQDLPVHALLLGRAPSEEQGRAALEAGARRVSLVSHPELAVPVQTDQLVAAFADVLKANELDPALVLLPAGTVGEELATRLAARLGGVPLGRCASLEFEGQHVLAHRPAFAGRAQVALESGGGLLFAAMRGIKRGSPQTAPGQAAAIERKDLAMALPEVDVQHVETGQKTARLEGAKIVVSGGRGIGGPEGFDVLGRLAASMGGVLGGSLPTVDAGWVPVARQVGQSGKYVTPEVYVAVGISGTPQHLAGIGLDSRIVAINSDADANIFRVAEVGVVAEWQHVVPALIEAMNGTAP